MTIEYAKIGEKILEALAMAGKKENLVSEIKIQNTRISDNNTEVAELQAVNDEDNFAARESIAKFRKELEVLTGELDKAVTALAKDGYKLPIGKKASKTISL